MDNTRARIWKEAVRKHDGDAYANYMRKTGIAGICEHARNRGVWMLRRDINEYTEFLMFTLWESLDSFKAFAGQNYETAVFYPEDDRSSSNASRSRLTTPPTRTYRRPKETRPVTLVR